MSPRVVLWRACRRGDRSCNSPAQLAQSLLAVVSGGQIRRLIAFPFVVDVTIQHFPGAP